MKSLIKEFNFSKPIHLENDEIIKNENYVSIEKQYTSNSSTGILWIVTSKYNGNQLLQNEWESYAVAEMDFTRIVCGVLNDDIFYTFTAERK